MLSTCISLDDYILKLCTEHHKLEVFFGVTSVIVTLVCGCITIIVNYKYTMSTLESMYILILSFHLSFV